MQERVIEYTQTRDRLVVRVTKNKVTFGYPAYLAGYLTNYNVNDYLQWLSINVNEANYSWRILSYDDFVYCMEKLQIYAR